MNNTDAARALVALARRMSRDDLLAAADEIEEVGQPKLAELLRLHVLHEAGEL